MPLLHIDTDQANLVAQQILRVADLLGVVGRTSNAAVNGLRSEWQAPAANQFETETSSWLGELNQITQVLMALGQRLAREVQEWEAAAAALGGGQSGRPPGLAAPMPVPVPTPTPGAGPAGGPDLGWLSDLFGTIDLTSDLAPRQYSQVFEEIGRWLNDVLDTRGYIKAFGELGEFLSGTAKAVNFVENINFLYDSKLYYSGELTNAEYWREVCNAIPIPFVGDTIYEQTIPFLQFPDDRWHGLVTPVY